MNTMRYFSFSLIIYTITIISNNIIAQEHLGPAVESWRSFLSYASPTSIASDGTTIFCGTNSGFFTYNKSDGSLNPYSKSNGMNDVDINIVSHDLATGTTVIGYTNSNIDIFRNTSFKNIPDLYISQISGDKTIYGAYSKQGITYLSTGIGLILINLSKDEVKETITFFENSNSGTVFNSTINNDTIYAVTSLGTYRTNLNNPNIQYYATWEKLNTQVFRYIVANNNVIYAVSDNKIYTLNGNTFNEIYVAHKNINTVSAAQNNGVWITALKEDTIMGFCRLINALGEITDSISGNNFYCVMQLENGETWYGVPYSGLYKTTSGTSAEKFTPPCPLDYSSFDVVANNGETWIAHGGHTANYIPVRNNRNISRFKDNNWFTYEYVSEDPWMMDFVRIIKDKNSGSYFASAFAGGVLEINNQGNAVTLNEGILSPRLGETPDRIYAYGLAIDDGGNLWVANNGAEQELVVKTKEGNWYKMKSIINPLKVGSPIWQQHSLGDIAIDQNNRKWLTTLYSGGIIVYDDNNTLENPNDDRYRILSTSNGNLPSNQVYSVICDKDGVIWIGTDNGIAVVNCSYSILDDTDCEATLPVLQEDQFAGHFFMQQSVRAMAVDGANRKWIGTSSGIWLVSPNGEETIYRFTTENSPLPSNLIYRINIDPVLGDVYISTDKGLVSFRSTATEGKPTNDKPLFVYPNPVPSGFKGQIAIRGIAENADVRITDISGQLVYRTKAHGGQAVWSGNDYTGKRAQSGVYLVFTTNKDGSEKAKAKIIFHE